MLYPKPYKTIQEQLDLLKSRGLNIADEHKAKRYLETIGYYHLSAYWYPFRKIENRVVLDDFRQDSKFEDIISLYVFDKRLRLHMLDALERIEIAIKTDIALALGKLDICAHRNPKSYGKGFGKQQGNGQSYFYNLQTTLDNKIRTSKDEFMEHFRKAYPKCDPPVWIAVELLEFGPTSIILSNIQYNLQNQIARKYYIPHPYILTSAIKCLSQVRNVCAHHGRLWNRSLQHQIAFHGRQKQFVSLSHLTDKTRLYSAAAFCAHMLKVISPNSTWGARMKDLIDSFPEIHAAPQGFPSADNFTVKAAGFEGGWKENGVWN